MMTDRSINHATFTLDRTYPVPPEQVFKAWADPSIKVRWFAGNAEGYELDFQPGGVERTGGEHDGKQLFWESLYREIVAGERIVYTSQMSENDDVRSLSLTTVQFLAAGSGCRLILVEAGAYLDGWEQPAWREEGTSSQLDQLGKYLEQG
jgi:uncharacterized protein YndB with AHSA1/START domain